MNWANSPGPAWATVVLYPWERRAADELETGVGKKIAPGRAAALLWD